MRNELLSLVSETKILVKNKIKAGEHFFFAPSPSPKKEPPVTGPKSHSPSTPSSMVDLLQKIEPSISLKEPLTPVVLFALDEPAACVAFLQKVGEAIAPLFGEVTLIEKKELTALSSHLVKLVVTTTYPIVTAKVGELTPLTPLKLGSGATLLPLHEISSYLTHPEQKRALWNTLKSLLSQ